VPENIVSLARARVTTTALESRGLGFVILHRCEEDFYFLIVCTWRNSNELWQTVLYKDGEAMPSVTHDWASARRIARMQSRIRIALRQSHCISCRRAACSSRRCFASIFG